MKILLAPTHALAAEAVDATDANASLWKSISDHEDKYAFDQLGPPLIQDRSRFEAETKLYQDMVQWFDLAAEDEPDFIFVVTSYDVPVDVFRPEIIRPGEAVKESADNPFGEDDPLPENIQSTSAYVEELRPTFLPGGPLKMHSMDEVKLGQNQQGSLFSQAPGPSPAAAVAASLGAPAAAPAPVQAAGKVDIPKKGPAPGSDEETLANLKAAVAQLGLERLNLDPHAASKEAAPDKAVAAAPPPAARLAPQAKPQSAYQKSKKKSHWVKNRKIKKRRAPKAAPDNSGAWREAPGDDGLVGGGASMPRAAPAPMPAEDSRD